MAEADAFWDYSCALYARGEVGRLCLELQDGEFGFNVNLLLLACYMGRRGARLDPSQWARAQAAIAGWQTDMLLPMRQLRRRLKACGGEIYERMKATELLAERHEQQLLLQAIAPTPALSTDAIRQNLQDYAASLGACSSPMVMAALGRLVELADR